VVRNFGLVLGYKTIAVPAALLGRYSPVTAVLAVLVSGGLIGCSCSRDLLDE